VFRDLRAEKFVDPYGPATKQFGGCGSFGNGGAMRISPAALFMYRESNKNVDELVRGITRITHSNTDAINGAILQCAAIQTALNIEPSAEELVKLVRGKRNGEVQKFTEDFVAKLTARMAQVETETSHSSHSHLSSSQSTSEHHHCSKHEQKHLVNPLLPYCNKLKIMKDFLKRREVSREEIQQHLGTDISALGSVPAAIYSFLRCVQPVRDIPAEYSPFETTLIYAISLGGDTDTIASMAGAIAGAYYGETGVRKEWLHVCEGVNDAKHQAEKLYELLGLPPDNSNGPLPRLNEAQATSRF
jgi:poly(ADP-ribose) glycohydrolase ARH3